MIIEQLTFRVEAQQVADWLATDAAVWDPVLTGLPGYLGKEVWITEAQPADQVVEVQLIVRWTDRASWKSVSEELLRATHDAMGVHAQMPRETVHVTADEHPYRRPSSGHASA